MTTSRLLRLVSALACASLIFAPGAFAKDGKPRPERADTTTILVKFATAEAADAAIAAEGDRVAGKIANDVRWVASALFASAKATAASMVRSSPRLSRRGLTPSRVAERDGAQPSR